MACREIVRSRDSLLTRTQSAVLDNLPLFYQHIEQRVIKREGRSALDRGLFLDAAHHRRRKNH